MTVNIGGVDRVLRAALGVILLYLAFASSLPTFAEGAPKYIAAAVGVVMLLTAAIRVCPLYSLLGFKTCKDC